MTETANSLSVRVGGITTKCAAFGSGPPLLYLHGAFGYAEPPDFLRELADDYADLSRPRIPASRATTAWTASKTCST